ncbi:MAG: cytochrome C oxidase subunit IV family protein [Haliscomenobacter sp.]
MSAHLTYEESKKRVLFGLYLLAGVTLVEVFISLLAKGHLIPGLEHYKAILYIAGLVIGVLSAYKAYFIVYEFMHMRYEVKGLALTILLPMALLIWAVIAFFQEGNSWKNRRELIKQKNEAPARQGHLEQEGQRGTYVI